MPEEKKPAQPAAVKAGIKKKKPSVLKRERQDRKRREHNFSIKMALKTLLKKLITAIKAKDKKKAQDLFHLVTSNLDKAARKRIIHKNRASRLKSRLARKLHLLLHT